MKPGPPSARATASVADLAGAIEPAGGNGAPPDPPAGLSSSLLEQWAAVWSSPLRLVIPTTSVPALARLFTLRQESADAHRECRDAPLLEGSQGQQVLNPACRLATELDKEIRQLEDRFGLNPSAYVKLGLISLAAEEAAARAGQQPTPAPTPRPDPRG